MISNRQYMLRWKILVIKLWFRIFHKMSWPAPLICLKVGLYHFSIKPSTGSSYSMNLRYINFLWRIIILKKHTITHVRTLRVELLEFPTWVICDLWKLGLTRISYMCNVCDLFLLSHATQLIDHLLTIIV